MNRVPSDIIKCVFHFLGSGTRFKAQHPEFHKFFYKMSQLAEYESLMSCMTFDASQSYPFCSVVDFALDRLQLSNLLVSLNPNMDWFEASERLASDIHELELFSDEETRQIKEMAELFRKEFIDRKRTVADYNNSLIRKTAAIMRGDRTEMEGGE